MEEWRSRWKKWNRRSYELTVEELEKRRSNTKYLTIFYFIIALTLFMVAGVFLNMFTELTELPATVFTNYILYIVILGAMVVIILFALGLQYITNMKYQGLKNELIDIMIYLKKVNGK